jgi:hypothetical protein
VKRGGRFFRIEAKASAWSSDQKVEISDAVAGSNEAIAVCFIQLFTAALV